MTHSLIGTTVVTLAVNLPGPLAAARLSALGARVVKVEPPAGDPLRTVCPTWYDELSSGQEVVTIDLKDAADRPRLDALLTDADILITAMRPSALRRLGLDDPTRAHPRLSLIEIVGHDGDRAEEPGHDLNYQAEYGTLTPPVMPTVPVADLLGAERAVSAALGALLARSVTGTGQLCRIVLEDAAAHAGDAVRYGLTGAAAPLGGTLPQYSIYRAADGHVALGALEPHFWQRTRDALGIRGDRDELSAAFATRNMAEWEAFAEANDIPLTAVRSVTPEPIQISESALQGATHV